MANYPPDWSYLIRTAFLSVFILFVPASAPTHATIEGESVRQVIKELRQKPGFVRTDWSNEQQFLLYIYEGVENHHVLTSRAPNPDEQAHGIQESVTAVVPVKHSRNIKIVLDTSDPRSSVRDALLSENVSVDFRTDDAIYSFWDSTLVDAPEWPLNWSLGPEAGRPLTCEEAVLMLEGYGWEDASRFLANDAPFPFPCGRKVTRVWDGNHEGKQVRDLLYAVLSQTHANKIEEFGRPTDSFQILPLVPVKDGVPKWDVLADEEYRGYFPDKPQWTVLVF